MVARLMDWWDVGVGIAIGYLLGVIMALKGVASRSSFGDNVPKKDPPPIKGNQPNTPPRDWSKVVPPQTGSSAQPPKTGIIPGRPGQTINEGPGTWIPPMRPDKV